MQPDPESLRRYYDSLSDEALLEIDPVDLTDVARKIYDSERSRRRIASHAAARPLAEGQSLADDFDLDPEKDGDSDLDVDVEDDPDWLIDASCACSFDATPGTNHAPDLDEARDVLEAAGIPCHAVAREPEAENAARRPSYSYDLMVPAALNLKAVSVLDKEFFNPRLESDWRSHFANLSDEELQALSLVDLTAGFLDRVERLTNAYNDEMARREE